MLLSFVRENKTFSPSNKKQREYWPWANPKPTVPAFLGGCTLLYNRCASRQMGRGLQCTHSSCTLYRTYRFNSQPLTAVLHTMFPLTCGCPGSCNYSCCSSPWQSHLQTYRDSLLQCTVWAALGKLLCGSFSKLWVQKHICSTKHNQHFTLHLSAARISSACWLKYPHTQKLY